MRRMLSNLEDQVGGLIAHEGRRVRRRKAPHAPGPDVEEPERYDLSPRPSVAIRAARASSEPAHRQVA